MLKATTCVRQTVLCMAVFSLLSQDDLVAIPPSDVEESDVEALPPYTDYCEMLCQEIQGRKHAFLAGNKTYYVGGGFDCWKLSENETLGLTHPFFHDLRGRGFGLVHHEISGFGHDFRGWEFYKETRVAYGTVLVDGQRHTAPVPVSMKWRPDKVICEYMVAGVRIREEKFVANNDAICSVISSDAPIQLEFDGRSLFIPKLSQSSTAAARFDRAHNTVHITEGGTVVTHPVKGETKVGKLIYDGMSTVLTSSQPLAAYQAQVDERGVWGYSFTVPCHDQGTALVWAMSDNYDEALRTAGEVVDDFHAAMAAKTKAMNELLNYEIPYFRCSDQDVVDVYYYLWAIYLMYYIDVQQGWEMYPHTQTAVHNFLGMHRYDANFQIKVGAWTAHKRRFAYGNVLHWKPLLPFARPGGALPDNKGIAWLSPVWGATTEHVMGAWQIYQHTGDTAFVHDCYDDYFKLLFKDGLLPHWGCHYDAAECLRKMAQLTGDRQDPNRWLELVNVDGRTEWLDKTWESHHPSYFGGGQKHIDWMAFAYLRNSYFPAAWADEMVRRWAIDSKTGFFWKVPLSTRAIPDLLKRASEFSSTTDDVYEFAATPDTNYYSLIGMYNSRVGRYANRCALAHLKRYNRHWGIPIAPEAWSTRPAPWGDQYSNFNAGKLLLILEGMAGVEYSLPDDTLTVSDTMPEEWTSMEVRIPVDVDGTVRWPRIDYQRAEHADIVEKTISVTGNPFRQLRLQPWLEEAHLQSASDGYTTENQPRGHIGYEFTATPEVSITVHLTKGN